MKKVFAHVLPILIVLALVVSYFHVTNSREAAQEAEKIAQAKEDLETYTRHWNIIQLQAQYGLAPREADILRKVISHVNIAIPPRKGDDVDIKVVIPSKKRNGDIMLVMISEGNIGESKMWSNFFDGSSPVQFDNDMASVVINLDRWNPSNSADLLNALLSDLRLSSEESYRRIIGEDEDNHGHEMLLAAGSKEKP